MSAMRAFFRQRKEQQSSGQPVDESVVLQHAFGASTPLTTSSSLSVAYGSDTTSYHVAVQGCCHGELTRIYDACAQHERATGRRVDLLICCGDFQAVRDARDLSSMAVPDKYKVLGDFCRYYVASPGSSSPMHIAPYLTIFVGGNHENADWLAEESYGSFVAPNIYYLGHSGVVVVDGVLRIAGLSGIYKPGDYDRAYPDRPYATSESAKRSAYHVRRIEVEKLHTYAMLRQHDVDAAAQCACRDGGDGSAATDMVESAATAALVDVVVSHDWPVGITKYGDEEQLLRYKPYFRDDIAHKALGNPHTFALLRRLRPRYWFAAHLHCYFDAHVEHTRDDDNNNNSKDSKDALDDSRAHARCAGCACTKFVALGKCGAREDSHLRFVDFAVDRARVCGARTTCTPPSSSPPSTADDTPRVLGADRVRRDGRWLQVLVASHACVAQNRCRGRRLADTTDGADTTTLSSSCAAEDMYARLVDTTPAHDNDAAATTTTRALLTALQLSPALPLQMAEADAHTCRGVGKHAHTDNNNKDDSNNKDDDKRGCGGAATGGTSAPPAPDAVARGALEPLSWSEDV